MSKRMRELIYITGTTCAHGETEALAVAVNFSRATIRRLLRAMDTLTRLNDALPQNAGGRFMAMELSANAETFDNYIRMDEADHRRIVYSPQYVKDCGGSVASAELVDPDNLRDSEWYKTRLLDFPRFRISSIGSVLIEGTVFKSDPELEVLCPGDISRAQLEEWKTWLK